MFHGSDGDDTQRVIIVIGSGSRISTISVDDLMILMLEITSGFSEHIKVVVALILLLAFCWLVVDCLVYDGNKGNNDPNNEPGEGSDGNET